MVGIEGILGSGGRVAVGTVGKVGSGGSAPGFGRDGWVVGNAGIFGCGRFGINGNGGSAVLGRVGSGGNCRRWLLDFFIC